MVYSTTSTVVKLPRSWTELTTTGPTSVNGSGSKTAAMSAGVGIASTIPRADHATLTDQMHESRLLLVFSCF
jgi:hypothetical protein